MVYEILVNGKTHRLELEKADERWECRLDGQEIKVDAVITRRDVLSMLVDGHSYEIKREQTPTDLHLWVGSTRYAVELHDPRSLQARRNAAGDEKGPKKLLAPMPGRIVRVLVAEKSEVEAGQGIVVVEAMKMQNEIKSPKKGIVQKILGRRWRRGERGRRAGHRRIAPASIRLSRRQFAGAARFVWRGHSCPPLLSCGTCNADRSVRATHALADGTAALQPKDHSGNRQGLSTSVI